MDAPGAMPATLDTLARSANLPTAEVHRLAALLDTARHSFCQNVDLALERLGGSTPDWPLLSDWNRWCLASGARFFVWQPERGGLSARARLEAFVHTLMMVSAKELAVRDYRASGVREAEVTLAGDDCAVCDRHRHRIVSLSDGPAEPLPPFHPGCRCGFLPKIV